MLGVLQGCGWEPLHYRTIQATEADGTVHAHINKHTQKDKTGTTMETTNSEWSEMQWKHYKVFRNSIGSKELIN